MNKVKNDLNIDVNVEYLINKFPDLTNNLDFMKEIIVIDPSYLQFDRTNNPDLYLSIVNDLIEKVQSKEVSTSYDIDQMVSTLSQYQKIANQGEPISGKYRIPMEYLNEAVRKNIATYPKDMMVFCFFNAISSYMETNDKFPNEYGEKIQSLWEDKDVRLGVHGMFGSPDLEERKNVANAIFKEGLRTSQQQIGITDLSLTAKVQDYDPSFSFLDAIDYCYNMGGTILLAIPEKCFGKDSIVPIWGGNNPEAIGQEFVLPEYVLGYVPHDEKFRTEEYFNNRKIVYNDLTNKNTYKYFFKNGGNSELMELSEYQR